MGKEGLTAKEVQHIKPGAKRVEIPAGPPTGLYTARIQQNFHPQTPARGMLRRELTALGNSPFNVGAMEKVISII